MASNNVNTLDNNSSMDNNSVAQRPPPQPSRDFSKEMYTKIHYRLKELESDIYISNESCSKLEKRLSDLDKRHCADLGTVFVVMITFSAIISIVVSSVINTFHVLIYHGK